MEFYVRHPDTRQIHLPKNLYIDGVGYAEREFRHFETMNQAKEFIAEKEGEIHHARIKDQRWIEGILDQKNVNLMALPKGFFRRRA